jgi:hypothetical protein
MAARVIHFGWDDCCRIPVLRAAGFEVREVKSLDELSVVLQNDEPLNAVFVSESTEEGAVQAAEMSRRCSPAPLILFRRSLRAIDEKTFDKVYSCLTPPDVWLPDTVALIAKGDMLRVDFARVQGEAAGVLSQRDALTNSGIQWESLSRVTFLTENPGKRRNT